MNGVFFIEVFSKWLKTHGMSSRTVDQPSPVLGPQQKRKPSLSEHEKLCFHEKYLLLTGTFNWAIKFLTVLCTYI